MPLLSSPLLCAGITTYNALRNAGLRGGDLVAVQGIGGLGHLGVQFARHMGFRTVAIGRGRDKEKLAKDLGAHIYIDIAAEDAAAVLRRMGGAKVILATGTSGGAMGPLVSGLAAEPGREMEDWLQAEGELERRTLRQAQAG
jgi:D-arabinose 1-dehydrogenase-like Zn-dependent alcohol dehydrogenase